jgi:outer membrane protein assembly factor BamB
MRRWLIAAGATLLLLVGAVAAYVIARERSARDVHGSSTEEFVTTAAPKPKPPPPPDREARVIVWPMFGFSPQRDRVAPFTHRPPYRPIWAFNAGTLLEFPPSIGYGRLYFTNNSGTTFALTARTGKPVWRSRSHRCVAATPALHDHTVFQAFLNRPPCNATASPSKLEGEVVAFDAATGAVRWRTRIGPSESSPLVALGRVYVGDWRGNVYALAEKTGRVVWTFAADGRVKGALAIQGGRVFVASYGGHVYALDARTGALRWQASSQRGLRGRGTFYSTPAIAYGRVYIGSTDGKVYSFGASSGTLRWSHSTGGYVYSSPAVWAQKIYAGSYSGKLYAFDAATGDVRWTFDAKGPISGSPTVMDGVVTFATLKGRTYALDARNGRLLWSFPHGQYTPLVADSRRVYLVGYSAVYGMVDRQPGR